jgi:hypothetical protein
MKSLIFVAMLLFQVAPYALIGAGCYLIDPPLGLIAPGILLWIDTLMTSFANWRRKKIEVTK